MIALSGFCPMGCGKTLYALTSGTVACQSSACPRPFAAADLLSDQEAEHIVVLGETEFTVWHPLRERLDDALMHCSVHRWIAAQPEPPEPPGRYRVFVPPSPDDPLRLEPLPEPVSG